jgi:hypothetical protein
VTSPKNSR